MGRYDIDVHGYWHVIIIYDVDLNNVYGLTKTYYDRNTSIVMITKHTSKQEKFNTLIHELKHVQSHICKYYNVREDGEKAAYLIGFLAKAVYDLVLKFR